MLMVYNEKVAKQKKKFAILITVVGENSNSFAEGLGKSFATDTL